MFIETLKPFWTSSVFRISEFYDRARPRKLVAQQSRELIGTAANMLRLDELISLSLKETPERVLLKKEAENPTKENNNTVHESGVSNNKTTVDQTRITLQYIRTHIHVSWFWIMWCILEEQHTQHSHLPPKPTHTLETLQAKVPRRNMPPFLSEIRHPIMQSST